MGQELYISRRAIYHTEQELYISQRYIYRTGQELYISQRDIYRTGQELYISRRYIYRIGEELYMYITESYILHGTGAIYTKTKAIYITAVYIFHEILFPRGTSRKGVRWKIKSRVKLWEGSTQLV